MNLAVALSRVERPLSALEADAAARSARGDAPPLGSALLRVGVMDGDIYGPSVPTLMRLAGLKAETNDGAPIVAAA